jgi:hypothetical protein
MTVDGKKVVDLDSVMQWSEEAVEKRRLSSYVVSGGQRIRVGRPY